MESLIISMGVISEETLYGKGNARKEFLDKIGNGNWNTRYVGIVLQDFVFRYVYHVKSIVNCPI